MTARALLAALVLAAAAAAADSVVEAVGARVWERLPEWRRAMVEARWRRFQALPEGRRREIEARGLGEFLLQPVERPGLHDLPPELRRRIEPLPPEARRAAARVALLRWRQILVDAALEKIEDRDERWRVFLALYPEPFDAAAARAANRELRRRVKEHAVASLRRRIAAEEARLGRALSDEERREFAAASLQADARAEAARAARVIRRELDAVLPRAVDPPRLERRAGVIVSRLEGAATPRERVLLRYALDPASSPLADAPGDATWDEPACVLARLDLLAATDLPAEDVLALAGAPSGESLVERFLALRRNPRSGR